MGAWGAGPRDNDSALDFETELTSGKLTICEFVDKGLKSTDENEQRIAAHMVASLGDYSKKIHARHVRIALKKMEELLVDKEWIATWKSRSAIRKTLRKQISLLEQIST